MPTTEPKYEGLDLWEAVDKTDFSATKKVEYGAHKFTSIDANWQRKQATEIWGPYGSTWGLKDLIWQMPQVAGREVLVLYAKFYYPSGEFEIASDMPLSDKRGYVKDSHKQLQTDVLTKALSYLGFSADVFMGKFDENKYVAERIAEEAAANAPPPEPPMSKELFDKIEPAEHLRAIPEEHDDWRDKRELKWGKKLKEMDEKTGKKILGWLLSLDKA